MYVDGRNLMLFRLEGGKHVPVASCVSCSVAIQTNAIEVLPTDDWQWGEYAVGRCGWSVSANGLIALESYDLWQLLNTEVEVVLANVVRDEDNNATVATDKAYYRRGKAIVTSLTEEAGTDDKAQWSIQLQGSGKLKAV